MSIRRDDNDATDRLQDNPVHINERGSVTVIEIPVMLIKNEQAGNIPIHDRSIHVFIVHADAIQHDDRAIRIHEPNI